jgi:hypothetical protein
MTRWCRCITMLERHFLMKTWTFVKAYKTLYLALIAINFVFLFRYVLMNPELGVEPVSVQVFFALANVLSWLGLRYRSNWGIVGELVLSAGRMIAIVAVGPPLYLVGVIMLMSPVGVSVWFPAMSVALMIGGGSETWRACAIYIACAPLLALEIAYFYCLIRLDSESNAAPITYASGESASA